MHIHNVFEIIELGCIAKSQGAEKSSLTNRSLKCTVDATRCGRGGVGGGGGRGVGFMTESGKVVEESLVPDGRLSAERRNHPPAERRVPGGQN